LPAAGSGLGSARSWTPKRGSFVKNTPYKVGARVAGQGLVLSEGNEWLAQRAQVEEALHADRVARYGSMVVGAAERMLAGWREGEERELHTNLVALTMDITCSLARRGPCEQYSEGDREEVPAR
jgi:cytochrome P450